jgi:hypothetical protein
MAREYAETERISIPKGRRWNGRAWLWASLSCKASLA